MVYNPVSVNSKLMIVSENQKTRSQKSQKDLVFFLKSIFLRITTKKNLYVIITTYKD